MENGSGIDKPISFSFRKTYGNVPFEHMHSKFAKSANMTPQNICFNEIKTGYRKFYEDSKFVETGSKKYYGY